MDRLHGLVRLIGEREFPNSTLTQRYSFVHVLYQNALEFSLTATRKSSLSGAIAECSDEVLRGAERRSGSLKLAILLHDARDFAWLSDHFLQAARNAARVYAYPEAVALCQRAIADAEKLKGPERNPRVLAAALEMGPLYQAMTQSRRRNCRFRSRRTHRLRVGRIAKRKSMPSAARRLCSSSARSRYRRRENRASVRWNSRGLRARTLAVASSEFILACTRWCDGEIAEAEALFDRGYSCIASERTPSTHPHRCLFRGSIHAMLSQYDDAERASGLGGLARAQELGAGYDRLRSLFHKGRVLGNRGRISDAWDALDEARRLAERIGERRWRSRLGNTQAWLLFELQDPEAALRLDTEAAQMAREFGDVEGECNSHINAARDCLALGEPARALEHLRRGEQLHSTDFWFRWVYHPRLQGELASYWITQGDLKQAGRACRCLTRRQEPKAQGVGAQAAR